MNTRLPTSTRSGDRARYLPAERGRPPRLIITPGWPGVLPDVLSGRADWGWARTHPLGDIPEEWRRIRPLGQGAPYDTRFSSSELSDLDWCEHLHKLRYTEGWTRDSIHVREHGAALDAGQRGGVIHRYLAGFSEAWSPEERDRSLQLAVAREEQWADRAGEAARLLPMLDRYCATPWPVRAREADECRRELPFYYVLDPEAQVTLEGRYDAVFREGPSWIVLDHKTMRLADSDDQLEQQLRSAAERYAAQLAVYAIVLDSIVASRGEMVRQCVLSFVDDSANCGASVELQVTGLWLAGWRERLCELVRKARRRVYRPEREWRDDRCPGCPLLRACTHIHGQ